MHYTEQKEALEKFRKTVYNIRVGSYKSLMPWQHGVITTSNGILEIFELLKNNHGIKFILTSRFNQVGIYFHILNKISSMKYLHCVAYLCAGVVLGWKPG